MKMTEGLARPSVSTYMCQSHSPLHFMSPRPKPAYPIYGRPEQWNKKGMLKSAPLLSPTFTFLSPCWGQV